MDEQAKLVYQWDAKLRLPMRNIDFEIKFEYQILSLNTFNE